MTIHADRFTPTDEGNIPSGELRDVTDTPFDFRTATAIGAMIDADDEQIKNGYGYDHNYVINREDDGLATAAEVYDATTGRLMEVLTTRAGCAILYRQPSQRLVQRQKRGILRTP